MIVFLYSMLGGVIIGFMWGRIYEWDRIIKYLTWRESNSEYEERVLSDSITGIVLDDHINMQGVNYE